MLERRNVLKGLAAGAATALLPLTTSCTSSEQPPVSAPTGSSPVRPKVAIIPAANRFHVTFLGPGMDAWNCLQTQDDPTPRRFGHLKDVFSDNIFGRGAGVRWHPHREVEIVTYMVDGSIRHKDSEGNGSVIGPRDVQRMSAGTGIFHSEFNTSVAETASVLQIWFTPARRGQKPSYAQSRFPDDERRRNLRLIVSGDGRDASVSIDQDLDMWSAMLGAGEKLDFTSRTGRHIWLYVPRGELVVNGQQLRQGDGATVDEAGLLSFQVGSAAELVLIDMS